MKLIPKITVLFLVAALFFTMSVRLTHAVEVKQLKQLELTKVTVNPGSFYYSFKRLFEKGKEKFIFSEEQKISFYTSLLKVRLSELDYVISNKGLSEIQGSSERFAYYAGVLTEELIKQNKVNEKENLIKEFGQYGKFLTGLRDKYPANSSFWMLVQHDINTLNILSERLK